MDIGDVEISAKRTPGTFDQFDVVHIRYGRIPGEIILHGGRPRPSWRVFAPPKRRRNSADFDVDFAGEGFTASFQVSKAALVDLGAGTGSAVCVPQGRRDPGREVLRYPKRLRKRNLE